MAGHAYIGTSGWNYKTWKNSFYAGIPQKQWLRFCAEHFNAVEINATFYRLQTKATFERWREQTPAHFCFAIKGNRYLTHNKKLADPDPSIRLDRQRATGLGDKLAAVLWQMPHTLRKNIERLRAFAVALGRWPEARHALEFRHVSWFDDEVAACLRTHRLAACLSDAADWPMWDAITTDMVYVRLHGHTRTYASAYGAASLKKWAARISQWLTEERDVHVYFDNDAEGAAPRDALRLIELVQGDG
jgi:uncharacterized protein YecE (DUF72 family)